MPLTIRVPGIFARTLKSLLPSGGCANGEVDGGSPIPGEQEVSPGEDNPEQGKEIRANCDDMNGAAMEEVRRRALEQGADVGSSGQVDCRLLDEEPPLRHPPTAETK